MAKSEKVFNDAGQEIKPGINEAAGAGSSGASLNMTPLSTRIQTAMSDAVAKCYEEGIIDPDVQREAMLAARQKVKDDVAIEEAAAAEEARRKADDETAANLAAREAEQG